MFRVGGLRKCDTPCIRYTEKRDKGVGGLKYLKNVGRLIWITPYYTFLQHKKVIEKNAKFQTAIAMLFFK